MFFQRLSELADHTYKRTTLIVIGCLAILGGIYFAEYGSVHWTWLLLGGLVTPFIRGKRLPAVLLVVYLFFILGTLRGSMAVASEQPLKEFYGQKITLKAVITEDGYFDDKKRIVFIVDILEIIEPVRLNVSAPVRVNTFVLASAARGDIVEIKGKLFPSLGNVAGSIGFAEVEIKGASRSDFDKARQNFVTGLRNSLPEPEASFGAGLLIGQRSSLQQKWQDILRGAGLTHIIAVSGYNLTILVRFARRVLKKRSRYQTVLTSGLLVTSFVAITGFSPSIIRALIVVVLLQLSWYYGREIKPVVLLLVAAAASALIDPFQLWRSVGWYLSFAAFTGVILIAPLFVPKRRKDSIILALVAESVAAGLMTWPIVAHVFGDVSLVGLIANIIVSPIVPLAMLLSFIAGLAGMINPEIAGWFAWPAHKLLSLVLDIAKFVSSLPGSKVSVRLDGLSLGTFYLLIVACAAWLYRRRKPRNMLE